jgi:hypothetical protein
MWMSLAGVLLLGGGVAYGVVRYRKTQAEQLPARSIPTTLVQDDLADIKAQLAATE